MHAKKINWLSNNAREERGSVEYAGEGRMLCLVEWYFGTYGTAKNVLSWYSTHRVQMFWGNMLNTL
jgi:hypothetical protein